MICSACRDPEITDSQCELHFPEPSNLAKVDSSHIAWIEQNIRASYSDDGYSWTRLGYTYDWGNPDSNIGLSEFVVRPRSTIQLERVTTTESYCR